MIKEIKSIQNPFIKRVLKLQEKSRERKKLGLFVVEGQREISLALKGKYNINTLLFCPDYISIVKVRELKTNAELISITKEIYQKLAYRDTTEGLIAIVKEKKILLKDVKFATTTPLILVVHEIMFPPHQKSLTHLQF